MKLTAPRISEISSQAHKRYKERFHRHGAHVQSLGWDTLQNQQTRFAVAASLVQGDTVLDIGCGMGDFYHFLKENRPVKRYRGIDLLPEFIEKAKQSIGSARKASFLPGDFFQHESKETADTVIALGILNYRLKTEEENYGLISSFLEKAWTVAKRCVIFDGISIHRATSYPPAMALPKQAKSGVTPK